MVRDIADTVNCMITTKSFLETKLVVGRGQKTTKAAQKHLLWSVTLWDYIKSLVTRHLRICGSISSIYLSF